LLKHLDAKPRLLTAILVAALIYFLLPQWMQLSTRILFAWDIGVIIFLSLVWVMMMKATTQKMQRSAQRQDESRWTILGVIVAAACASLLAIGFMLSKNKNVSSSILTLHIILTLVTIVVSWLLIHTMFALHYAHLYYQPKSDRALPTNKADPSSLPDALDFPSEKQPDYWDFLYFSLGIGMTCQVSDVPINSRLLRRLVLIHEVLTFFFNTVILALAINILASLI
jgi:uncharacterized membrane protein